MKFFGFVAVGGALLFGAAGCTPVGMVIGGAATAGVTAAQERSMGNAVDDAGIKVQILNDLLQENEKLFADVSTSVVEGRVLVTGEVPTHGDREKASEIIWKIDGVRQVLNELQVGDRETVSSVASDSWISTKLKARLLQDLDVRHINYSIDTVNQIVYLFGIAQDQSELDRVFRHAKDISGVRKIISHVVLKGSR
ncbi:BON domain-containing protein [Sneathiella chinensis]|uniref:BON domain-containing protein n=1 Tax=Sneathiella chinensis TaxID=349750 RepID=A0ABQ5U270_9PROT|nr:BON domain-containing protein [Sneathiella chinensis]GLQ05275.1 BON domain-containing protein [Sneathiella chinensis]